MRLFAVCAAILAIKMLATANATGFLRTSRGVYSSPEDYHFFGKEVATTRDEHIERIRRAHQNDLENILPFFAIGFLYVLTGPSHAVAATLIVAFTVARVAHTAVYIAGLQPWRTVVFAVAQIALYLMALIVLFSLL